jgi:SPP1 family predicted phage head-tail adaptor
MRFMIRHAKNERVTIKYRPQGEDQLGQAVAPWVDLCPPLWAYREGMRGREYVAGDALQAETMVRYQVAMRSDITAGMRLLWGTLVYDIKAVVPYGRDLDLMTVEIVGDGR